jgi:hypothetical protein
VWYVVLKKDLHFKGGRMSVNYKQLMAAQQANLQRWIRNQHMPAFTADIPDSVPDFTPANEWDFPVLAVYLPDLRWDGMPESVRAGFIRSIGRWWNLAQDAQYDFLSGLSETAPPVPVSWKWGGLRLDANHLQLHNPALYQPGIRWEGINLASEWRSPKGVFPKDERGRPAEFEALVFASYVPEFAQRLDGVKGPKVWLPGLQAFIERTTISKKEGEFEPLSATPILHYNGKLCLDAYCRPEGDGDPGYAEPVVYEL